MSATIHVEQMSLLATADHDDVRAAIRNALNRDPDVVGFTEAAAHHLRPIVVTTCASFGYLFHGDPGDTGIAVAARHRVLDHGAHFVIPAGGDHGPRYINWVEFVFHGSRVTHHEAHWVTVDDGQPIRRRQHHAMTEAMINSVTRHGQGDHIALFAGDVNIDEATDHGTDRWKPHWMFEHAGLTTVYDELRCYPDTHDHRTIDLIGSYDPDVRVTAARVKVWPLSRGLDHQQVSAWYDIEERNGS